MMVIGIAILLYLLMFLLRFINIYLDLSSYFILFYTVGSGQVSESKAAELTRAANHVKELANHLANDHRDLHAAVSRIGKTIDKVMIY